MTAAPIIIINSGDDTAWSDLALWEQWIVGGCIAAATLVLVVVLVAAVKEFRR